MTLFYTLAMLALGLHTYHGFWSMFQTLGLNSVRTNALLRGASVLVALVLVVGFLAAPIAIVFGFIQ